MKQLHTTYSNLGPWKEVRDPLSGLIRIKFDQRRGLIICVLLFIFCMPSAVWLAGISNDAGNDGVRIFGVWILAATSIIIPLIIVSLGIREHLKGDLIRYHSDDDILELPRTNQCIKNARQRVIFSSEHYTNCGDNFFEFNVVLDGQRVKFLSSIAINSFKSLTKSLEASGFTVNHQKIKV
jgi:hypothetical protein